MPVIQKNLYELYADYKDEQLLRILTAERAMYRPEALAAVEKVLMRRGVDPTFVPAPLPAHTAQVMPAGGPARSKNSYGPIDLFVDVLLFSFLYLITSEMDIGSVLPESWLADGVVRLFFFASLTVCVMYVRQVWRTKVW